MRLFDLDSWHEVFSTLRTNKLRTAMTASGVFWGIFMLVLMLGFGNGLEDGVSKNMLGFVSNSVYLWGHRSSKPYKGLQPGRPVRLDSRDTQALARELEGLSVIAPRIQLGGWRDGNNVTHGAKTGNFGVMGDVPELTQVELLRPYEGRFINALDVQERRKVCVIGEQVRRVLFDDDVPVLGKQIKIRSAHFQVVGVYRSEQPGEQGERANNTLHVPFSTFQSTFSGKDRVGWYALVAEPGWPAARLESDARRVIAARHSVSPEDNSAIGSYNAGQAVARVENLFWGIRAFIWFVGAVTLAAGALGVSNILLISVKERTREMGVRKALGATPGSVMLLVLQEALLLTLLAGYLGLVFGVAFLELVARFLSDFGGPLGAPRVDLSAGIIATGVLAVAGLVAGIAPARHAALIRPVEALRSE